MIKMKANLLLTGLLAPIFSLMAINPDDSLKYANWQNLDPILDKKMGVSTEKAYSDLLKGKKSKTVIVAVIDSGVDIEHEDLKDIIWLNKNEIADNGIDDDKNGYVDDIHGWNFIGNKNGENISHATLEVTRLYRLYENKFPEWSEDSIKNYGDIDFDYYQKVVSSFNAKKSEAQMNADYLNDLVADYVRYDSIIKSLLDTDDYTDKELKSLKVEKKSLNDSAKKFITKIKRNGLNEEQLKDYQERFNNQLKYNYNPEFLAREVIGDDEYEWTDKAYGNKDVEGEDPSHGTMVSGVIGGVRNNNIGINGIADNIKIMSIRTVPDGDEWDKDVASAIKYAIDNGAEIINMSFGKSFSPQKAFVDSIIKLVDKNDVLLVQAAGNDGKNIDLGDNFPNKYSAESDLLANNWITVGASAISTKKKLFVASFSNYGKNNVDIFAPGHNMLLCAPDNKYQIASGTSFAAPVVSGVAALIKSYYPNLTAADIKTIIMQSSTTKDYKTILPGTSGKSKETVAFSTLSVTGGLVNVYEALKLAETKSK